MNNHSENIAEPIPAEVIGRAGRVSVMIETDPGDPTAEEFAIEPESLPTDLALGEIDTDYLARPIDMTELPFDWSDLPEADFELVSPGIITLPDPADRQRPARQVAPTLTRAGTFERSISRRSS